jgi:DNA-binding protein HU-beta
LVISSIFLLLRPAEYPRSFQSLSRHGVGQFVIEITRKAIGDHPMGKPMTKSQIIAAVAEKANISKVQAKDALEGLAELAYEGAADGFTIPGIGKLVKVNRAARMGRNPATGATIQIPAKTVLKFRIAKAAKDAVL